MSYPKMIQTNIERLQPLVMKNIESIWRIIHLNAYMEKLAPIALNIFDSTKETNQTARHT